MIRIIPAVKELQIQDGFLKANAIFYDAQRDERLNRALEKLPVDRSGARLEIALAGESGEGYELWIGEADIRIRADGPAGAFYAVQTLRQIFRHERIPCLYIRDNPDFSHRGFYHDVTRGKVPTVETIKELIDRMAYYKFNSLQLYMEHVFEFEQFREMIDQTGYLSGDEIREIDCYCRENFIDFIPSLSSFGHLYELLKQDKYRHLRILKDYRDDPNFWADRMRHHTIDPREPGSLELIKSLIDQYAPLFTSEYFNICCDETFDLKSCSLSPEEEGELYVGFVNEIIKHVRSKGKTVMMWGDILLQHPEAIGQLPEDTVFLNWNYKEDPPEENVIRFAQMGRTQIVCPGTTTWNRFCEDVDIEEQNICRLAEYGYKHGAAGILNTNWGDWGNLACLELSYYGLVLGAEKSWSVSSQPDESFYREVGIQLYENEQGMQLLRELSRLQGLVNWRFMCRHYFGTSTDGTFSPVITEDIRTIQDRYTAFVQCLQGQDHFHEEMRREMLLAAQGVCLIAELYHWAKEGPFQRVTDTEAWLAEYRSAWMKKNKESELAKIEKLFYACEANGLQLRQE